jgi:flavin-dependent dehydrogenase
MASRVSRASRPCGDHCDAFVIGGGPAGATAARLIASWGWSVVVAHHGPHGRQSLAESLPSSTRKLLAFLGQLGAIEGAHFHPNEGNASRWAGERRDTWTRGAGFHVERSAFDTVLRREAAVAGARVVDAVVRRVEIGEPHRIDYTADDGRLTTCTASVVLDCSGRAGVVARRGFRRIDARYRTLAITAEWECAAWPADEHTRTVIESYGDGWAWSVPLSAARRQCTVMVDPKRFDGPRRLATVWPGAPGQTGSRRVQATYARELEKTQDIRRRLVGARQTSMPRACDASVYDAPHAAEPGVLLVGDAASFIEPLSSAGVKKSMTSAWRAAVVANTCLMKPSMAATSAEFHAQRERQVYAECQRLAAVFFNEAAVWQATAFWSARAGGPAPGDVDRHGQPDNLERWDRRDESASVRLAFDRLRDAAQIRLRPSSSLRFASMADIEGREVVLREGLVLPGDDRPVRFAAGVNLPALVRLAAECDEVPALFSAYNTHVGPVPMDGLLTGLSLLVARHALISEDARS